MLDNNSSIKNDKSCASTIVAVKRVCCRLKRDQKKKQKLDGILHLEKTKK